MATDIAPFKLIETTPGNHSLLLSEFQPAGEVFDKVGSEGGGYAWAGVARHVVDTVDTSLQGELGFDPEGSMFCAYGKNRDALEKLGQHLARLFHDHAALLATIETIGPDALDD